MSAGPVRTGGQLSGWDRVVQGEGRTYSNRVGIRYLPELTWKIFGSGDATVDLDIEANLYAASGPERTTTADRFRLYRAWVRYSRASFDLRLGLQKISFGPARMLRSLMWFDRLDPRDPLQLTDGVYGLRVTYTSPVNTSLWMWALTGNEEPKGWEVSPTKDGSLEYGVRIQRPVPRGEMALTAHRRVVDFRGFPDPEEERKGIPEARFALDGIWDLGVGIWFEMAAIRADLPSPASSWQSFLTAGTDYTFAVGNGVHFMGEYMRVDAGDGPFDGREEVSVLGLGLFYPVGIMDRLSVMNFSVPGQEISLFYLDWQRTTDLFTFHVSVFWNARTAEKRPLASLTALENRGIQLMAIFDH
ncbi:MAG: hypothetical protein ACE5LH_07590 [Fidelibacterota bacterium]